MNQPRIRKKVTIKNSLFAIAAGIFLLAILVAVYWFALSNRTDRPPLIHVSTIAGIDAKFGEPFGVAQIDNISYISDGLKGMIFGIDTRGTIVSERAGFDTPSGLAVHKNTLLVADPGRNAIYKLDPSPTLIAGIEQKRGFADGNALSAIFNGPTGIAAGPDGKIYVSDTYNDRIRVIDGGKVTTVAGSVKGFGDGPGSAAKFDTPTGIAIWNDKLLIADTGNRRIRVVEPYGRVWTLAGSGEGQLKDGLLLSSSLVHPTGIAVDAAGSIFITDGNAIRMIGGSIPVLMTLTDENRGAKDGNRSKALFNRPSGIAFDNNGDLVIADSENRLVRRLSANSKGHEITANEIDSLRDKPEEFRSAAPARWPYDPPTAKRDIAGTLGEVRGEVSTENDSVWFHNGLDIAGAYGETARFLRDEKVLRPVAAENFATLRELIRMPTLGYIHIRLGRSESSVPFGDERFLFEKDGSGKLSGVRVPRGAKFKAGEPIGTLNAMNHVHLVAGRSGSEMNALDALSLPGVSDTRPPVIEKVTIYDQNWNLVETSTPNSRIKLTGNTRIVVKAYDQVDGNSERRRLGVYKLGYQILDAAKNPIDEPKWTIKFDRMPPNDAVRFVYADKSHSGATGETIFNYIVTNFVEGDEFREGFVDKGSVGSGNFFLKVLASDYFGNVSSSEVDIEIQ